jgi:hypothetical protein
MQSGSVVPTHDSVSILCQITSIVFDCLHTSLPEVGQEITNLL